MRANPDDQAYQPFARLRGYGRMLRSGAVIAYPTEAVYGLGCDPENAAAVQRILVLKHRSVNKGLILVAAELGQLRPYLAAVDSGLEQRAVSVWPGPVTWLWPAGPRVPRWLIGKHDRIAVRVSAHAVVRALCWVFGGALVSTSANRSGRPAIRSSLGARACFGRELDAVVPGTVGGAAGPTEIRDLCSGRLVRGG
jgi:L-threonylcarbamoyladenylate synthase